MNIFSLLKNKVGEVALSTSKALAISATIGVVATTAMHNIASNQVEQELQVRALSSLSSGYNYEGMRNGRGGLSSINVKNLGDGYTQVANAEERARIEGYQVNNDFGLGRADRLQNNFSLGQATQMGASDGLSMGGNEATEKAVSYSYGAANPTNVGGTPSASLTGTANSNASTNGGTGNTLGSASMARASGSSFAGNSGNVSSTRTTSTTTTRSTGANGAASGDGYRFTGAMPSGTNLASMRASQNGGVTGFNHGSDATVSRAQRAASVKGELRRIADDSATVAKDDKRAANAGSAPFLAGATQSGGITLENGVETQSASSADFEDPTARKLKAVGDWGNNAESEAERRAKARKKLLGWMLGTLGTALACMIAASFFVEFAKNSGFYGSWGWAVALAILAPALYMGGRLIHEAMEYAKDYHAYNFPSICYVVSGLAFTGCALTMLLGKEIAEWISNSWDKMLKAVGTTIGMPMLSTTVMNQVNSDK